MFSDPVVFKGRERVVVVVINNNIFVVEVEEVREGRDWGSMEIGNPN